MDISAKREVKECAEICPFLDDLKWGNNEIEILGTGGLRSQYYPSDFDLYTAIKGGDRTADDDLLYRRVQQILKRTTINPHMFFIEVKIQNADGSKKKFYEPYFSYNQFENAVGNLDYIKIDYVVWIAEVGRLQELSIIYSFGETPEKGELIKDIKADYENYKKEGNKYKALKRLFSISRLTGNKMTMVLLSTLFNSHTGQLYSLLSNIKAIKLLIEHRPVEEGVGRFIEANLRDIAHRVGADIDTSAELDEEERQLTAQIGADTEKWLREHKFNLP